MKKTIVIVLVLSLVISNFAFASTITLPNETEWYYEAVKYCDENGLIEGVLEGEIKNEPLTRAEFLTIFMRTIDKQYDAATVPESFTMFKDVEKGSWYEIAVYWAYCAKVTNGTSADTFSPNAYITREQAATMIIRRIHTSNMSYVNVENPVVFADMDKVSDWAKEFVSYSARYGIFQGDEKGNFNPQKNITQPEGLMLFMRLHKDLANGNLSYPTYDTIPSGDIDEPDPEPTPTTPVGSDKTPVPDQFVTFEGKEYSLINYDSFMEYAKAVSKTIKWANEFGLILEKTNRIATPGGNIKWMPPQKLKATDSIEENVDKLSVDNLAPIEWLEQSDFREIREEFVRKLNDAKIKAGGGKLIIDEGLMATAQNRAEQHARAGLPLDHSVTMSYMGWTPGIPRNRFGSQPSGSEILAYDKALYANRIVSLWMNSEKHRNTIMREDISVEVYVGVGVARIEGQGYFICAVFSGTPNTFGPYDDPDNP